MSGRGYPVFATDKDLHDLMISARQRLTETVLLDLARDRRVFLSSLEERTAVVDYLSMLPHDNNDLFSLLERGSPSRRAEKTTSIELPVEVDEAEIRQAILAYEKDAKGTEKVVLPLKAKGVTAVIEYSEFDYARSTLIQRQDKQAELDFTLKGGKTIVRFPATEKAAEIVENITARLEAARKQSLVRNSIEVTALTSAELRTTFFTSLITGVPDFKVEDVTALRVAPWKPDEVDVDETEDEEEAAETAASKMLVVVRKVALSGQNLTSSEQYQQLRESGFYITSIRWTATQKVAPFDQVQFSAGFEDGEKGTGFRYMVRYAKRSANGKYPRTMTRVPLVRERELFSILEAAAREVLSSLLSTSSGKHEAGVSAHE